MIKNTADVKQKSRPGRSRWGRVTKVFWMFLEIKNKKQDAS